MTGGSHHSELGVILGSIGGAIALVIVAGIALFIWKSRRKVYRRDVFTDVAGLSFDNSLN